VNEKPAFIQGLYSYRGAGLACPIAFDPPVSYTVPADKRAHTIYFRAGNASPEMIYLVLTRNGEAMRFFPVGAEGAIHVALAVVEDLEPDSRMEILVAAPKSGENVVILDIGFLEIA
jgi:hypothetical protein